ncbi:MAG: B12-binding domain-containing radical SAM protein [Oscillospiraceae bacterium]|nr:B12-binding domain-containing radical SAM protein [Oscillospiraceae bacterium]
MITQITQQQNTPVKLLLVYPDYTEGDAYNKSYGGNYSEGLASISASVKSGGHDCVLFHLLYDYSEHEFKNKIKDFDCDIIGFSIRTTIFNSCKKLIKWTKEALPDCFVFCGGYHVTLVPDEVLETDGVDAVMVGEGELPTLEFCDKIKSGEDYTDILSMYFKMPDGSVKKNNIMPLLEDLDKLPIPDFNLFDYKNLEAAKIKTAIVMMSRGCLFSCTYCGNSQFRNVYPNKKKYTRFRSAENALKYLETLLELYPGIEYISFRDSIFNSYPDWFDSFIELYKNKINKPFTCNLRLDLLTEETVRKMKEAGCYLIDVGVESGDYEIRTKYLKRMMTDEQMINAFNWFHKYGITTLTYNIIGLPHENLSKALKTIKLNVKLNPDKIIPNIFYPYPMTVLRDIAKEAGFLPDIIPADCRVPLKQDNFKEHEVLYAANYFMKYIKRYRRCEKLPKFIGKPLEKYYDFVFTGPLTPRKFLVWWSDRKKNIYKSMRSLLINKTPGLYLKIRNRRLKNMQR